MSDTSPKPTVHFRYSPSWKAIIIGQSVLLYGFLMYVFVSMLLGYLESDPYIILFCAAVVVIAPFNLLYFISSAATSHDGLHIEYLFFRTKFIPWHAIHELRIRRFRYRCLIKYGENPVKKLPLYINRRFLEGQRNYKYLMNTIINHAQLNLAGKNLWWHQIYIRN